LTQIKETPMDFYKGLAIAAMGNAILVMPFSPSDAWYLWAAAGVSLAVIIAVVTL
jgi:hypothetical protein